MVQPWGRKTYKKGERHTAFWVERESLKKKKADTNMDRRGGN